MRMQVVVKMLIGRRKFTSAAARTHERRIGQ